MKNNLTALGAPELSAGLFYRVRADTIGVCVEVRRKRLIGSTEVTRSYVFPEHGPSPEIALVRSCNRAASDARTLEEEKADQRVLFDYRGDHK
ncbi:hypothetical protein JHN55_22725 [Streptomyces sp. MBT56]|uniref:hypothetical protein n=1 Tax=unclassified Streptomyces TaxID=2593676 RepID=UPI00190A1411|nr:MULTISPECIES: hypothetical protein [unclassified Streptomyces]MBK3559286.1 hypothetical protein [Streptomyces sp. MBT56]MBK3601009.1 hypothetical protein [Streptomyces sp. MBT54]MBK3613915.1 hypothetical protein [Streptomyces sp. MBT98]MBK6042020.1 hypothetical protein [Streptomyces sp. MBT55]